MVWMGPGRSPRPGHLCLAGARRGGDFERPSAAASARSCFFSGFFSVALASCFVKNWWTIQRIAAGRLGAMTVPSRSLTSRRLRSSEIKVIISQSPSSTISDPAIPIKRHYPAAGRRAAKIGRCIAMSQTFNLPKWAGRGGEPQGVAGQGEGAMTNSSELSKLPQARMYLKAAQWGFDDAHGRSCDGSGWTPSER